MYVQLHHFEDLGDGRVRAFARCPGGEYAGVVMGRDRLGTPDMYAMLGRAAERVTRDAAALAARKGKADSDE